MKYINLFVAMLLLTCTSCLKSGLEDLPEFEEAEISGVQKVEYRYYDKNDISVVDGLPVVKYVSLNQTNKVEGNTLSIEVTVPAASGSFTEAERAAVSTSNIAVMVTISTAARLAPVGGAPKLGVPGDWSKPNKYIVTAANGNQKEWIIQVTKLIK